MRLTLTTEDVADINAGVALTLVTDEGSEIRVTAPIPDINWGPFTQSYRDYQSDEPNQYGIPDGLTDQQYLALRTVMAQAVHTAVNQSAEQADQPVRSLTSDTPDHPTDWRTMAIISYTVDPAWQGTIYRLESTTVRDGMDAKVRYLSEIDSRYHELAEIIETLFTEEVNR
jgi:hypothetical protein